MSNSFLIDSLNKAQRILLLSGIRKDYLITKAIFSDETNNFRTPLEPTSNEVVTIKIRTAADNVDSIFLHYNGERHLLSEKYTEGNFNFYLYNLPPMTGSVSYYFEILKDENIFFYNKQGVVQKIDEHFNFKVIYDFKTPNWAKGAVMYQIYIDRFNNGDSSNNVETNEYIYLGKPTKFVEDWNKLPEVDDIRNFYGGDLQGIMQKFSYLKELGVEVVYLNPVFVSPSNHKYDIQDYDYVDPHIAKIPNDGGEVLKFEKFRNRFATKYIKRTTDTVNLEASNNLMIDFINLAHEHGIKVILDGVFNHCGAFNKWLDREGFYSENPDYPPGAYKLKESPYHNYFKWYDFDNWPNNDAYDSWWNHDNHPKLNFEASENLCEYILNIGKKWVSPPFNADGWRLDVAADLGSSESFNHSFWKRFRNAVHSVNPDALIIAEHYGDATSWLNGDEWDTIMNYDAFMEPITWFLTGMEKHSEDFKSDMLNNGWVFESAMRYHMASLSIQSLNTSMNQLSNHDHSRFLTRTNMKVGRLHTLGAEAASENINYGIMREAITFQFTWPGAPAIYYGDEAGVCGWTDPDNRRTYPWGNENQDLISLHKELAYLRKSHPALKTGSLDYIFVDYGILCYGRWDENDTFIIILNNDNRQRSLTAPVWKIGCDISTGFEQILSTDCDGFSNYHSNHMVKNGQLSVFMPPFSSLVLHKKN